MSVTSAMRGYLVVLQAALTVTGNGLAIAIPSSFSRHTIIIKGSAGISAGAVQPEMSDDPAYAGTWVALGSPITAVASEEVAYQFTGIIPFLRARISTDLVGGTITVTYVGS